MLDVVAELCESRDKVNILPTLVTLKVIPKSLKLGDKGYLEHFKSDAGSTAGFQSGVDRLRLWVGGERSEASLCLLIFLASTRLIQAPKNCNLESHNLVLFHYESCYMSQA